MAPYIDPSSRSIQVAIDAHAARLRPQRECAPRPSYAGIAKAYNVPKSTLSRHMKALRETGTPAISTRSVGRPPALTWAEERAVVGYIIMLDRGLFPAFKTMAL